MAAAVESRQKSFSRSSPSTAFDQYLQDIQKLPLITDAEEEKRLARRAQQGDEKAAERLVTANLRFVISYVKKYQGHGLDLSELVAIGNEGLLKAVRKFDPEQGVKFISYAVWWVRQAVLKALAEQTRSVRIPLNQNSQLIKLARAETVLSQVLKRDPTDHELSRLLEETPAQVRTAKQMSATEISLDAPIDRSDREASTLGERFAGVDGGEIEDVTDFNLMREFIDRSFKRHLTPRERKILYLYYGLGQSSEAMTLEKIGAMLGVTRERIRQIRERAFDKLRKSPDGCALGGFCGKDLAADNAKKEAAAQETAELAAAAKTLADAEKKAKDKGTPEKVAAAPTAELADCAPTMGTSTKPVTATPTDMSVAIEFQVSPFSAIEQTATA